MWLADDGVQISVAAVGVLRVLKSQRWCLALPGWRKGRAELVPALPSVSSTVTRWLRGSRGDLRARTGNLTGLWSFPRGDADKAGMQNSCLRNSRRADPQPALLPPWASSCGPPGVISGGGIPRSSLTSSLMQKITPRSTPAPPPPSSTTAGPIA